MTKALPTARKRAPVGDAGPRAAPVARLRDAEATRAAILAAARKHFAASGYEGALLRDIAADAGADAALINRYFGGKDGLFQAVIERTLRPEAYLQGDRAKFARHVAAAFASTGGPRSEEGLEAFSIILHAATSRNAAALLDKAIQSRFMGPIADWLGGEDSGARARLFTAMIVGLMVERLVRGEPLAGDEQAAFKHRLTAMLQSLVDG
jgi:AcrR family transcriptional regulator